jgi:hypothetical protein
MATDMHQLKVTKHDYFGPFSSSYIMMRSYSGRSRKKMTKHTGVHDLTRRMYIMNA